MCSPSGDHAGEHCSSPGPLVNCCGDDPSARAVQTDDEDVDFGLLNCRVIAFDEPDEDGDV
mgnify:CR=1 FL=1